MTKPQMCRLAWRRPDSQSRRPRGSSYLSRVHVACEFQKLWPEAFRKLCRLRLMISPRFLPLAGTGADPGHRGQGLPRGGSRGRSRGHGLWPAARSSDKEQRAPLLERKRRVVHATPHHRSSARPGSLLHRHRVVSPLAALSALLPLWPAAL